MLIIGDLMNEEKVLEWLIHQKNTDEIEDVSDAVLDNMIDSTNYLAVLFCKCLFVIRLFNYKRFSNR